METLPELISRVLHARGESVTAFANRVGVSRQTVARWGTSLPAADTLRRVATDLEVEVPYSQVLSAALASAGYIDSLGDMLAGQPLRVVTTCEGPYMERGEVTVAGVFTDPVRAEEYVRIAEATSAETDIEEFPMLVDATEFPDTMLIYTTTWWSRTDQISQTTSICLADERPARLARRDVSDVEASELTDSDSAQVFSLRVDSLTPEGGRARLTEVLDELRRTGQLLSPDVDPYQGWSGLAGTSWLSQMTPLVKAAEHAHEAGEYSPPSSETLSNYKVPAANFAAPPIMPTLADLAATRESLEAFLKRGFTWGDQTRPAPKVRRFVVDPGRPTADGSAGG